MPRKKTRKLERRPPNPDTLAVNMKKIKRKGYFLTGPIPVMTAGLLLWLESKAEENGDEQ